MQAVHNDSKMNPNYHQHPHEHHLDERGPRGGPQDRFRYQQQELMFPQQTVYGYVDPSWEMHAAMMQQMHDFHGYEYQHPLHQHMDGVPLPPGIPGLGASTDPLEAVLGAFPCARLRRLPFDATLEDILILFQGLVVIDVVLIGQGEAFVIFANPMDFQMALQRDRQTIGRSFVEITPGSRSDYYNAIAIQQWHEQQGGPPLRSDDRQYGEDTEVGKSSVDSSGWGSTVGMLSAIPSQSLSSSLSQPLGVGGRGDRRGGGPTGLVPGGRGGPGRGSAPAGLPVKRTGGGIQVGEHTGFLRMRGLPFSAAREDIYTFFKEYNPVLETIVLTYRSDGRATGEAYIGFETPEDSKRAMELHKKSMGSRYIELFLSNKEEHGRALARFGDR